MKNMKMWPLALMCCALALSACGSSESGSGTEKSGEVETTAEVEAVDETNATSESETAEEETAYEITYQNVRLYTNSIGTVWMQAIAEITNTGTSALYLSSSSYDLEDSSGSLVASKSLVSVYPDVLQPGEKGIMYDETTIDDVDADTELTILPRISAKKATVDCIRLGVSDLSLSDDRYSGVKMIGRVENTTGSDIDSMIYVVAILYNADNEPIGKVFTIIMDDLAAGDKIGFEMSGFSLPDDVTTDTVADYIVYAYPDQFQF